MNRLRFLIYILFYFIIFCSPNSITASLITLSDPAASDSPMAIPVTLTIAGIPQASISWSPGIFSASTVMSLNAPAQTFSVWNSGGGTLSYSITVDQSWLSCFPASGTSTGEHDSITVSYSTASLSLGTYSAIITISDPAADNSPQTIPMTLIVTSFPQAIVELNFEEGEGTTAFDSSGNSNNGTLYGEAVYTKDRAVGSYALSFDGTDDRVVCTSNSSLRPDDISVALWVKHIKDTGTGSSNYGGIIQGAFGDGYQDGFRILDYWNRPLAQISFGDAEPLRIEGTAFTMNEWSHVVVTYDHTKIRLYQNGQLVVERPETRNINWAATASDLSIGLARWYFSGIIDRVMIFGSALSTQQVRQVYSNRWASSREHPRTIRPSRSPSASRGRAIRPRPPLPEASISRSPSILSVFTMAGNNASAQTFDVWDSGGGTLSYSITVDQSWLSCFPADGTSTGEHDSITVSYSTASLSLGTYSATITISDPAADNSTQTIPVTLTVTSFPQAIVELNFEEGDGTTAYDSSGNNNNGILYGGAVYTTERAVGSYALSFDGIDDCVVCGGNFMLRPDDISVTLWVKHVQDTSSPNYRGIIQGAYGNGYHNGFRILDYWNKPLAQINFGDAEPLRIEGTAFTMNEWSHVVVTYNHTKIRLYQNGQLVVERPETRDINWAAAASDLSIGLARWYYSGIIDKVMIFSSALTTQQVQQLYTER